MTKMSSAAVFCVAVVGLLFGGVAVAAPVESNTLSPADIAALTNNTQFADILSNGDFTIYNQTTTSNGTEKQLYVIKAVVYEVGILTEIDDNSTESDESHERVDLTFFNAHKNGSVFDFGSIPVPIQANITGHTYTEILPLHVGDGVHNISELASILPLPENVLNFTHSDSTLFQYQTNTIHHNPQLPLADEQPLEYQELPPKHHQHVSQDDLLRIPVVTSNLVVDFKTDDSSSSSSSSSSSEEDEDSENGPRKSLVIALGPNPLANVN